MRVIETARLTLRAMGLDDAGFILDLLNQPSFLRYIGDKGVRSLEDARRYIQSGPMASYDRFGFGLRRVGLRETGEPAGICGLLKRDWLEGPDLGFAFLPVFWSRGYASEASRAVLAEAREAHGLARVLAVTSTDNVASMSVLRKLGFAFARLAQPPGEAAVVNVFVREGGA
jgi:ribosomal-protein-alanine N-acetyltransferase